MKVTISRKNLVDALAVSGAAVPTRTTLPILSNVKITSHGSTVDFLCCDGEMWASHSVPANVETEGEICVPHKLLSEIASSQPDGDLTLTATETSAMLSRSGSEWKLSVVRSDDFPSPPETTPTYNLSLGFGELADAIDGVQYAASDDSARPILQGVLFKWDEDSLTLVSTDTHRLAYQKMSKPGLGTSHIAVVPSKALRAIQSLPIEDSTEITLAFDDNRMTIEVGACKLVTQLLSGQFPNWEKVIPQEPSRFWTFERDEFIEHIRRALILARDNGNRIVFSGSGDNVTIAARSEDRGSSEESIACVNQSADITIAFNGRYLNEAITHLHGDGIKAEMSEPTRPVLIRSTDGSKDRLCVLMPMAIE